MPSDVDVTAVRRWYLARFSPTTRWRETWERCFDGRTDSAGVQPDGQDTLLLSWKRDRSEGLFLRAAGERGEPVEIVIGRRTDPDMMPCQ
jgi:hypothetical protein